MIVPLEELGRMGVNPNSFKNNKHAMWYCVWHSVWHFAKDSIEDSAWNYIADSVLNSAGIAAQASTRKSVDV